MILPKKADATIRCTHPHVLRPIAFWFLIVFTTYASAVLGRQAGSRRKSGEEKRGAEEEEEEDRRKINRLFMEAGITVPFDEFQWCVEGGGREVRENDSQRDRSREAQKQHVAKF